MCKNSEDPLAGSAAMKEVIDQVNQVADLPTSVLLTGETGVGKNFIAKQIHERSSRKEKPFFTLNCAALAEGVGESELFGHIKGAYTGAYQSRKGFFESADGATLFINEIGKLSLEMQMKFLQALEESEIIPMGTTETRKVNIRVIAAATRDLKALEKTDEFMSELYYRLEVFPIHIPPLRERRDEIEKRAKNFIEQIHEKFVAERELVGKSTAKVITLTQDALKYLKSEKHPWEGNLRELRNKIESAMVWAKDTNKLTRIHFRESETLFDTLLSKTGFTWKKIEEAYKEESPKDRGWGPTDRDGLERTLSAFLSGDLEKREALVKIEKEKQLEAKGYVGVGAIENFVKKAGKRMFPELKKFNIPNFIEAARIAVGGEDTGGDKETNKADESSQNENSNEPPA